MYASDYLNKGESFDKNYAVSGVLADLSKAFDCIPHYLLIAKLCVYGFNGNALKHIYKFLKNRKQCRRINVNNDFKDIISGVLQSSIVVPILFKVTLKAFNNFKNKQQKCFQYTIH